MRVRAIISLAVLAAVAGCSEPKELNVNEAWVRLGAAPGAPAVAYFSVEGGPTEDRLLDVSSPNVIRVELHESMSAGGMASMKPIAGGVAIPAGSKIEFKEGGKHAMLFNINPGIKEGRRIEMNFTFASGTRLQVQAPVVAAGSK